MKKLGFLTIFVAAVTIVNAQTVPQKATAKKAVAKQELKKESCKKGMSCCKNEKALSALRRPSKPAVTPKKS